MPPLPKGILGHMQVIDAHVHVATKAGLKLSIADWMGGFPANDIPGLYDDSGRMRPDVFAAHLNGEGVRRALLFSEYSPRVTGWQVIEDLLPFREYDPDLFSLVANVNPHVHHPLPAELRRQLDLGAIALKLHPVHGGFPMDLPELYPVYALCESSGVPIFVHSGTSNFPGARNRYASLDHLVDVVRDFPGCTFLLSHGGRGWSYDTAAMLALTYDNVYIDIAGLPPRRLPVYYARQNLARLARRFVFGSDWPGLPSISGNVAAIRELGLPEETVEAVLYGNAAAIFGFGDS
jgi:Predicted metal-dependent hydrolase of the TIM-barrel fold